MTELHAIDAGCIVLIDPCYLEGAGQTRANPYVEVGKQLDKLGNNAPYVIDQHMAVRGNAGDGEPCGVVVQSGLGDGVYPVEARYTESPIWGRRIAEVRVRFIDEGDEV